MTQLPIRLLAALVCSSTCLTFVQSVAAQTEDSDCLYEFNRAYEWSESAREQIDAAQKYIAASHFEPAKQRYSSAISLLQQAIDQYRELPKLAYDCSPTNLTIAKNNIRLAEENLQWATDALNGIDCSKAVNDIESLSHLASDYFHKQNDIASARQTVADALQLAAQTRSEDICRGEYQSLLSEQQQYAQKISDSLEQRRRYEQCQTAFTQAVAAGRNNNWKMVIDQANSALSAGWCDGSFQQDLLRLKESAETRLQQSQ